jgi:hypothetical protein
MRRLMLLLVAWSFIGVLSGCHCVFTHGICDCDYDDHCASRSPWIRTGMLATPVEAVPAPAKEMPSGPKGL